MDEANILPPFGKERVSHNELKQTSDQHQTKVVIRISDGHGV